MKKIIILSSSLFTDRVLIHSTFLEDYKGDFKVEIWTTSYPKNISFFKERNIDIIEFPKIAGFRERFNYLRTICNISWANKLSAKSILSMRNFNYQNLSFRQKIQINVLTFLSKILNFFNLELIFENFLHNILLKQSRSLEAFHRLLDAKPDLLVVTNPFWHHESAIAIEAKKLQIKIYSFIPSWDNITTKSRFVFKSDYYGVWSEIRKIELLKYYPYINNDQVDLVGAPQYDVFFKSQFIEDKNVFLDRYNLTNDLPILLYVLGSPLFLKSEYQTCIDFIDYVINNKNINNFQILVRPHPNKDNNDLVNILKDKHKNIKIQTFETIGLTTEKRTQSQSDIIDWVSTFKYTDLLINLSSTSIFDSLYFDKNVINVNFDHTGKRAFDKYIKEINSEWTHLKTIYESEVITYANSVKSLSDILENILKNKVVIDILKKNKLLDFICNNSNGKSGLKLFDSISEKLNKNEA